MNPRELFNEVNCPILPYHPSVSEILIYLKNKATRERSQPYGREMDAREWAATVLEGIVENIKISIP